MTERLRRWHLRLWLVIGPTVAVLAVLGILARRPAPVQSVPPAILETAP
ncbi:MAG: hypothetical protein KDA25_12505 [Phycisphaerales bacterium]|nr:hypothetical protein [Phycisphaerales bacterium]